MRKRSRDQYLRRLAAEPLFANVPRHLMPAVGRVVDVLDLRPGAGITTMPAKETIVILEGFAVVHGNEHQADALVGPHMVPHAPQADAEQQWRLTAITPLRCRVVARRELTALLTMAPALARSLKSAAPERLTRTAPSYSRTTRAS